MEQANHSALLQRGGHQLDYILQKWLGFLCHYPSLQARPDVSTSVQSCLICANTRHEYIKCVASLQHLLDLLFCYFSDYNSLKAENILENNQLVSQPLVIKDSV